MSKIIQAEARISASDKTGNVFDKLAAKFKGIEKNAKALEGIKAPKFTGDLYKELERLKLSERQLQGVRKEFAAFDQQLRATPVRAAHYFRAIDDWKSKTVGHWREVKTATEEAHEAQRKFFKTGIVGAAGGLIGAGAFGYYGGRVARYAFDKSKEANRETTKQRQSGLTQAQSDAIALEADLQTQRYPSVSATEFRSAGREATMQLGSAEAGLRMMPTLGRFMTAGKVLWGSDKIDEQTRKALQVADARQITDPDRLSSLLDAMVRSSQVEGGADFTAADLRTALRYGRDMTRGQSDRFVTSVLPQLGVDMGYSQAGTGLMSMHSALIGGRQKDAVDLFQRKVGLRTIGKGLVGKDVFLRDVDKWFDEYYIPTLQKQGVDIDDPASVSAFNAKFFSNRTAADVAGNMISGRQQRVRRREQQEQAKGMAGADRLHTQDVGVALEAVNTQLTNMASSAKLAEAAIAGLNGAMGLIQQAGEKLNDSGGWIDKGKKQFEQEKRDAQEVGGVLKGIFDWDKRVTAAGKAFLDGGPGAIRLGTRRPSEAPKSSWPSSAVPVPYWPASDGTKTYSPAETRSWSDYINVGSARLGTAKRFAPPKFPAPEISNTMTYGTGVGGGPVQAVLSGSAEVSGKAEVTFTAGTDLVTLVGEMRKAIDLVGRLNTNGPGSNGKSSPDAAAP